MSSIERITTEPPPLFPPIYEDDLFKLDPSDFRGGLQEKRTAPKELHMEERKVRGVKRLRTPPSIQVHVIPPPPPPSKSRRVIVTKRRRVTVIVSRADASPQRYVKTQSRKSEAGPAGIPTMAGFRPQIDLNPRALLFSQKLPDLVIRASSGITNKCLNQLAVFIRLFTIIAFTPQTQHLFSIIDLQEGLRSRYKDLLIQETVINLIIQFGVRFFLYRFSHWSIGDFNFVEVKIPQKTLIKNIQSALTLPDHYTFKSQSRKRPAFKKRFKREWIEGTKAGGSLDLTFNLILNELHILHEASRRTSI